MRVSGRAAFAGRFGQGDKLQLEGHLACLGVLVHPWIGPETRWLIVGAAPGAGKIAIAREHGVAQVDAEALLRAAGGDVFGAVRQLVSGPGVLAPEVFELLLALAPASGRSLAVTYVIEHARDDADAEAWGQVHAMLSADTDAWSPLPGDTLLGARGTVMALRLAALRNELWTRPAHRLLTRVPHGLHAEVLSTLQADLLGTPATQRGSFRVEPAGPEPGSPSQWSELSGTMACQFDPAPDEDRSVPAAVAEGLACTGVLSVSGLPLVRLASATAAVIDRVEQVRGRYPTLHTLAISVVRSPEAWEGLCKLVAAAPRAWTGFIIECGATVGYDECAALARALEGREVRRLELGFDAVSVGLAPILETVHGQPLTHLALGGSEWYLLSGFRRARWWETVEALWFRNPAPRGGGMLRELFYGVVAPRLAHLGVEMAVHSADLVEIDAEQVPTLRSVQLPGYNARYDVGRAPPTLDDVVARAWFAGLRKLELGVCTDEEIDTLARGPNGLDWLHIGRGNAARALVGDGLNPLARWGIQARLHARR